MASLRGSGGMPHGIIAASPAADTETVMATIDVTKTAILAGIHQENGPLGCCSLPIGISLHAQLPRRRRGTSPVLLPQRAASYEEDE